MSYDTVIDVINEKNLSWSDIDRIHLREPDFEEFTDRASFSPANYSTTDKPAVRLTNGEQKLFFVREDGYMQEVSLE